MSNPQHRPNHHAIARTITGPAFRGRPITDFADRYGTRLRSGRPVPRRRDRHAG